MIKTVIVNLLSIIMHAFLILLHMHCVTKCKLINMWMNGSVYGTLHDYYV